MFHLTRARVGRREMVLGTLIVLGGVALLWWWTYDNTLAHAISECATVSSQERFSCYRSALEEHREGSLQEYLAQIEADEDITFEVEDEVTYAVFGTNCHTFYHALGDYVGTHGQGQDLEHLLSIGSGKCTAGYTMGLLKRVALTEGYESDVLQSFYEMCPEGQEVQCSHEIGHVLHDKYTTALLSVVDRTTIEYGVELPPYQYTTFPDAPPDLDEPFEECDSIIPEDQHNLRLQCRTGIGHNMFVFSEFDPQGYTAQLAACGELEGEHRSDCYKFLIYRIGINETATRFISGKFEEGSRICEEASEAAGGDEFRSDCYIGLGGGIGLFVDSEYAVSDITDENIASMKEQLNHYLALCEESPQDAVDWCLAGLFGTRFAKLYDQVKLYHPRVEELRPTWQDFEVVG